MASKTPNRHNAQQPQHDHPEGSKSDSRSQSARISTPRGSSGAKQETPLGREHRIGEGKGDIFSGGDSHIDDANCDSSYRPSSQFRDLQHDRRRSILKRSAVESAARGPRQSVSFAKQKEVVTFRADEDRSSLCSSETVSPNEALGYAQNIQQLPLSPVSERKTESSRGSTSSASPVAHHVDVLSSHEDSLFILKNDTDDLESHSPFVFDWEFPGKPTETEGAKSRRRSSAASMNSSPGGVFFYPRMSFCSETSSAGTRQSVAEDPEQVHGSIYTSSSNTEGNEAQTAPLSPSPHPHQQKEQQDLLSDGHRRPMPRAASKQQSQRSPFRPAAAVGAVLRLPSMRTTSLSPSISPLRQKVRTASEGESVILHGSVTHQRVQDPASGDSDDDEDDANEGSVSMDTNEERSPLSKEWKPASGNAPLAPVIPFDFSLFSDRHQDNRLNRRGTEVGKKSLGEETSSQEKRTSMATTVRKSSSQIDSTHFEEHHLEGPSSQRIVPRISLADLKPNLSSAERRSIPQQHQQASLVSDEDQSETVSEDETPSSPVLEEGEVLDGELMMGQDAVESEDGSLLLTDFVHKSRMTMRAEAVDETMKKRREDETTMKGGDRTTGTTSSLEIRSRSLMRDQVSKKHLPDTIPDVPNPTCTHPHRASSHAASSANVQPQQKQHPHVPLLSFRTPRIVGTGMTLTAPGSPQGKEIQSQYQLLSTTTLGGTKRVRGPFQLVDAGLLERLEDGTGRLTPRPDSFDLTTIQLGTTQADARIERLDKSVTVDTAHHRLQDLDVDAEPEEESSVVGSATLHGVEQPGKNRHTDQDEMEDRGVYRGLPTSPRLPTRHPSLRSGPPLDPHDCESGVDRQRYGRSRSPARKTSSILRSPQWDSECKIDEEDESDQILPPLNLRAGLMSSQFDEDTSESSASSRSDRETPPTPPRGFGDPDKKRQGRAAHRTPQTHSHRFSRHSNGSPGQRQREDEEDSSLAWLRSIPEPMQSGEASRQLSRHSELSSGPVRQHLSVPGPNTHRDSHCSDPQQLAIDVSGLRALTESTITHPQPRISAQPRSHRLHRSGACPMGDDRASPHRSFPSASPAPPHRRTVTTAQCLLKRVSKRHPPRSASMGHRESGPDAFASTLMEWDPTPSRSFSMTPSDTTGAAPIVSPRFGCPSDSLSGSETQTDNRSSNKDIEPLDDEMSFSAIRQYANARLSTYPFSPSSPSLVSKRSPAETRSHWVLMLGQQQGMSEEEAQRYLVSKFANVGGECEELAGEASKAVGTRHKDQDLDNASCHDDRPALSSVCPARRRRSSSVGRTSSRASPRDTFHDEENRDSQRQRIGRSLPLGTLKDDDDGTSRFELLHRPAATVPDALCPEQSTVRPLGSVLQSQTTRHSFSVESSVAGGSTMTLSRFSDSEVARKLHQRESVGEERTSPKHQVDKRPKAAKEPPSASPCLAPTMRQHTPKRDADAEVQLPTYGIEWEEFQEYFCDGKFRGSELTQNQLEVTKKVMELIHRRDDETELGRESRTRVSRIDDMKTDWTLEDLMVPTHVHIITEYFKQEVEASKLRLSSRVMMMSDGAKPQPVASLLHFKSQQPIEVVAFLSFLPKTGCTPEEALRQLKRIEKAYRDECLRIHDCDAWVEVLHEICERWKERREEAESQKHRFRATNLARVVQQWIEQSRRGSHDAATKLAWFRTYIESKSECALVRSSILWKLQAKTKHRKLVIQMMKESLKRYKEMLCLAHELQDLVVKETEIVNSDTQELRRQKSFQAITERAVEQLKQSLEFERKAAEKSKEKAERRKAIVRKLQERITMDAAQLQEIAQHDAAKDFQLRQIKDIIRWAALEKDLAEIRQKARGYELERKDLDSIEVSVIPGVHFDQRTDALLLEYLQSPEVQTIVPPEMGSVFDEQYSQWSLRRVKLIEELGSLEFQQGNDYVKGRLSNLLHLAVPARPFIRIWWRYDVSPSIESTTKTDDVEIPSQKPSQQSTLVSTSKPTPWTHSNDQPPLDPMADGQSQSGSSLVYEGMKVMFSSGLCDEVTQYMPTQLALLQPQCDVTNIEGENNAMEQEMKRQGLGLLHRRYIPEPSVSDTAVSTVCGNLLYEREIRRCLFKFVEERLNKKILREMKDRGYYKPSYINQLLNHHPGSSPKIISSFDCFAPQFPSVMITDTVALCLLHARSIELLMEQQRELIKRFPPLGISGGTEVTYVRRGISRHHYQFPPTDRTEISICEDDEVVFHIELQNHSLQNTDNLYRLEKATVVIVCNVVFSLACKSWIVGARESVCEVLMDQQAWDLTDDELESRLKIRDAMAELLRDRIRQWKRVSRMPTSYDLVQIVCEVEAGGLLLP